MEGWVGLSTVSVNNLLKVITRQRSWWDWNPRPLSHWSEILQLRHLSPSINPPTFLPSGGLPRRSGQSPLTHCQTLWGNLCNQTALLNPHWCLMYYQVQKSACMQSSATVGRTDTMDYRAFLRNIKWMNSSTALKSGGLCQKVGDQGPRTPQQDRRHCNHPKPTSTKPLLNLRIYSVTE